MPSERELLDSYPIVAPDYAKVRSGLAKKIGPRARRLPGKVRRREASALLEVKERADNEAPQQVTRNTTGL